MTAKPLRSVLPNKPELVVHAADLTVTARALASLLKAKSPNMFEYNGAPAILVPAAGNGATMIRPLTCNEIIIEAHKLCQPVKHNDSGRQEVTLPDKVAELYLAMSGDWELRPLTGISTAPILRHDGSIRWEQGYDKHSGLFCDCDLPALSLPDRPSRDDAERALATLRRPFRTHAFADRQTVSEVMLNGEPTTVEVVGLSKSPGKDESAFLVALLTAVARPSLPLAPAVVLRAPAISGAGTGKGLLARALAMIAFGLQPHAAALGDGKEFEKGLTAELLRADPSILIDNVNRRELRSPILCTSLSERPAMLR